MTLSRKQQLTYAASAAGYTIRFKDGVCKGGDYFSCERLLPTGEWVPYNPDKDFNDCLDSFKRLCNTDAKSVLAAHFNDLVAKGEFCVNHPEYA